MRRPLASAALFAAPQPFAGRADDRRRPPSERRASTEPSATPTAEPTRPPEPTPSAEPADRPNRPPSAEPAADRRAVPSDPEPADEPTPSRTTPTPPGAPEADPRPPPPPANRPPTRRAARSPRPLHRHPGAPADTGAVIASHRKRDGIKADRKFDRAVRAFSAKLDAGQRRPLSRPAASSRSFPTRSSASPPRRTRPASRGSVPDARRPRPINNVDERVDADVAIVDTGVALHPDLNVVGGVTARRATASSGGTRTATARTWPARSPPSTTRPASSASRPVPASGRSGSSTPTATACCRGTSAASIGSSPSATRSIRSRPLIESVNMSVAKSGSDDLNCGVANKDILHQAICRLYAGGITVVAAAANEQQQRGELRPGGLQRGHHGLGAGRHGRQGRRARREPLLLVGHATTSTTRSPTSATTAPTSTSSRRASASGRRSLGRPTPTRRGRRWRPRPWPAQSRSTRPAAAGDPDRGKRVAAIPRQLRLGHSHRPGQHPRTPARCWPGRGARVVQRQSATPARRRPADRRHGRRAGDVNRSVDLLRARPPQLQRRADRLVRHARRDEPVRMDRQEHDRHDHRSLDAEPGTYADQASSARTGAARRPRPFTVPASGAMPFTDVDDFAAAIEWLYDRGHHRPAAQPTLFCPTRGVTTRPDGDVPGPCARPAGGHDRLTSTTTTARPASASINALAKGRLDRWLRPATATARRAYVTRAQMAMFLDRALALPNTATTDYFDDDDGADRRGQHQRAGQGRPSPVAAASRRYCPQSSVTREQMAAFLVDRRLTSQGRLD